MVGLAWKNTEKYEALQMCMYAYEFLTIPCEYLRMLRIALRIPYE